jgi:hypothetical protein
MKRTTVGDSDPSEKDSCGSFQPYTAIYGIGRDRGGTVRVLDVSHRHSHDRMWSVRGMQSTWPLQGCEVYEARMDNFGRHLWAVRVRSRRMSAPTMRCRARVDDRLREQGNG